jgi:UDP-N-acetylenolpyruvoylglucosamine reductase
VSAPAGVDRDYPLSRLTTVRAGGSADYFARPSSEGDVVELLAWAEDEGLPVGVVGSGSNLLVSDQGFRGVVMKLTKDLTAIEREGTRVVSGGGARLPSAAARAASWGLAGLEFGVNIPGTVGGAVRMNANAYGGELGKVLETVTVCTASGAENRRPDQLGLRYRGSGLGEREVVTGATFALSESNPADVKATMADMRRRRKEAQPSGIKTFGSTFINPDDPRAEGRSAGQLLDDAGCRGLAVGGARLSPKHANFVENTGKATTADILGVMAAARHKVFERTGIVLEPEVQILGDVAWPDDWQLET